MTIPARQIAALISCAVLGVSDIVAAQSAAGTVVSSSATPNKVTTRIGTLDFKDGAPSKATLEKVYDNVDFTSRSLAAECSFRAGSWFGLIELFIALSCFSPYTLEGQRSSATDSPLHFL